ncbi:hypothetical protein FACS1894216_19920 [Synergistales bacterium]|nr:hypothetical protein FACS1894216_19920 [Synergistales bacterium]
MRKQLLWDACNKLRAGHYVFGGTGEEERDWLHISDVVKLLRMSESHASIDCPIVNGGSGIGYSVEDILTHMGKMWDIESIPAFSGISREGDPSYLVADITRILEWGFVPGVALTEGLLSYVKWYKRECAL